MKVLFLPEVIDQFLEIAEVLYDEGYLGFKDSAIEYSVQLFREIQATLPIKVQKGAPSFFDRYGANLYYSAFKRSKHTIWYVFYSVHEIEGEVTYLVRYLTNNHVVANHMEL